MAKDLLSSNETNNDDCVPRFRCPLFTEIVVPGKYLYAHITRPGPSFPQEEAMKLHNYGVDIVSGKFMQDPDYCRINFCDKGFVKTIVVLTKKVYVIRDICKFELDVYCIVYIYSTKILGH